MREKILIIEDDNDINSLLSDILENENYNVTSAFSGTEGLIYIDKEKFNLIILDLMLPGKSGEEVIELIRERFDVPVIIISAKEEKGIKAKLLRIGADDFISKPFDIDEVLARVYANIRRYKGNIIEEEKDRYKEIKIDLESRCVKVNEEEIILTSIEFDILNLLIKYPDKVFSKTNLFKSVWGEDFICDDNTITVHISNLRNKIKKAGAKEKYIKTIWGIGYKLNAN